ncbi:MAG: hypothetical protein ISS66_02090 [Desulfobacteraceae bacterium]|nr:hypothetical protein [Bacteroidota bacterium]MBL7174593.1 hypothetical protein [Desulfobacteraceae bacterium]
MKKIAKRGIFIGFYIVIVLTLLSSLALAGKRITIVGTVNDYYQIVTDEGTVYDIAENEKGDELAELVDKKVRVVCTLEEEEDSKVITIESYKVIDE